MIKLTGVEWKQFMADATIWLPGAFYDDSEMTRNDQAFEGDDDEVQPSDTIKVYGGVFFIAEGHRNFETVIKAWKKSQTHDTVVVTIPKDKAAELSGFLALVGGAVSK